MPNHIHVVLVSSDKEGLCRTFGNLHRRQTGFIDPRRRTTSHLLQGSYGPVIMEEALTYAALRKAESVERPVGSPAWLADMEVRLGRPLAPQKRGPKPGRAERGPEPPLLT
ncbi:hypothetical protein [Novosphingobium sp. NDB2Meth1]|uniref:hypothetical protein n=1 Tax=Novosphingobium sp. NDB2Meth1 TaxID=1892847 RepID=UPI0009300FCE|nr:hypothetical protein [Novosphingobium sp. NDB2Meth1]